MTFRDDGGDQTGVSITDEAQGVLSRGVLEPNAAWKATADTFFFRIKDPTSVRASEALPTPAGISTRRCCTAVQRLRRLRTPPSPRLSRRGACARDGVAAPSKAGSLAAEGSAAMRRLCEFYPHPALACTPVTVDVRPCS